MNEQAAPVVFVYGSLKPGGSAWAQFCEGRVARQQPARVRGRLFLLAKTGYPALVVEAGSGGQGAGRAELKTRNEPQPWVKGWLLGLRDEHALRAFDEWEEYDPQQPAEKNVYQRVRIECFADGAENSGAPESLGEAWVYVMTPGCAKKLRGVECPDGEWPEPRGT